MLIPGLSLGIFACRATRHLKSLAPALLAALMTMEIYLASVGLSPPPQAAINLSPVGQGFTVTAADLAYILKQIKIAEFHAANTTPQTGPCGVLVGSGPNQIPSPLVSFGLRTVDGSCNNLQVGQERYGSADQVFPRLTKPVFGPAETNPPLFGPPASSSYAQTSGNVFDSQPRLVSNLIVDQTSTNPAAVFVAGFPARTQGNPGVFPCAIEPTSPGGTDGVPAGCVPAFQTLLIPNVTTDVGLSPPFNSLFTIFGQFFDHGLDKITNGGNGQVFVPLRDDDPLVAGPDHSFGTDCGTSTASPECTDNLPPQLRFMVLTRGTIKNDPVTGIRSAPNTDTPFVDQSQTYTSHSSHQIFLREYKMVPNPGVSGAIMPAVTGKFLSDAAGGMATWAMIKEQAATKLGLQLVDVDVNNIPMLAADPYGNFIPGPNGLPQYVTDSGLVEGNLSAPVAAPVDVHRIETAFLNDIAHSAAPGDFAAPKTPDTNTVPGGSLDPVASGEYDNELLDLHYICGDGRCNENIALTAVHEIFHMEHDRLVDYFINPVDGVLTRPENAALLAQYQATDLAPGPNKTFTFEERIFQAARFVTEMQYQHLVFEEFARKVQPAINPFQAFAFNQTDLNPAITAEFAHAVYRFGHSMLTDTIPRLNSAETVALGAPLNNDISLLDGFLNPVAFNDGGNGVRLDARQATGAILMGLSDQVGNEIDEFVADTLRNNLLGLPLDLPSINMARARSEGIPSLNNVRRQIFAATNDGQLRPYSNWIDFDQNLKHHASLVNFIAAYGKHPNITGLDPDGGGPLVAGSLQARRLAADQIVNGTVLPGPDGVPGGGDDIASPSDSSDFLFSTGAWANAAGGVSITGLDDIDLWMGGLAENTNLFGGLLGPTFNYVFEKQLTDLQNGDRFYYLARTPGMNLRTQLEGNSFAELVMRNVPSHTLKADPFATADCKFELGNLTFPADPNNSANSIFGAGSVNDDPATECNENLLLLRQSDGTIQYRAINSVDPAGINGQSVYNGTDFADQFYGGNDNDTFWGGLDDDRIEGGGGDDVVLGGEGDDIITDFAGADFLKGGPGNDAIDGGIGDDIIIAGSGKDFTNGGGNINETFAGPGDDFAIAGQGEDAIFGDSGDDWEEGGDHPDLLIGDSSSLFFDDHNEPGNDILIGQGGDDDYDMEGGDDIGVSGPGVEKVAGAAGYDWEIGLGDPQPQEMDLALPLLGVPLPVNQVRDRFNEVEALSGWKFNDTLRGDSIVPSQVTGGGFIGCDALDAAGVARIHGLDALVPESIRTVDPGPIIASSSSPYCPLTGPVWGEGNILLGGGGSDTLEGRGANDIIDGDRYLNVRLSIRAGSDDINGVDTVRDGSGAEIGSTDLMENPPVTGDFGPGTEGMTLQQAVFAGKVNPGNIVAIREILLPEPVSPDCGAASPANCDTAVFSGPQSDYSIVPNADGSVTVIDNGVVAGGGGGGGGRNATDGTDTLWNIEQLSFCDVPDPANKGACLTRAAPVPVPPTPTGPPVAPVATVTDSLNFGSVTTGITSAPLSVTVNNTGNANLVVSGVSVSNPVFAVTTTCGTVAPGADCTVTVTFSPSAAGAVSANLVIAHNAGPASVANVSLSGTGVAPIVRVPVVGVAPAGPLAFGSVTTGTSSASQSVTVSNSGNADLIVSSVTTSDPAFSVTGSCGTLAPGSSCNLGVSYAPTVVGVASATLTITHTAAPGASSSVALSGTGVAPVVLNPVAALSPTGTLAFGPVSVGSASAQRSITVSNSGNANLIVSGVTVSDAAFTASSGCSTVPPGGSCAVAVSFAPTAAGAKSATVAIAHNSLGIATTSTVGVSGTAVRPRLSMPASRQFGARRINTSTTVQVAITNRGPGLLAIDTVTTTGAVFSATRGDCPAALPAAATCKLRVTFRPRAFLKAYTGKLTVVSNAANSPTVMALAGRGGL